MSPSRRHDQVVTLARRANEPGVDVTLEEYRDRVHLWQALAPMFPDFQTSIDQLGTYVRELKTKLSDERPGVLGVGLPSSLRYTGEAAPHHLRMARLHLVIGPVGAGKSTFASQLCRGHRAVSLNLND